LYGKLLQLLSGTAAALLLLPVFTFAADPPPLTLDKTIRCEHCNDEWEPAGDRVVIKAKTAGKLRTHYFTGLAHARQYLDKRYPDGCEIQVLQVLDYTTFGGKSPAMVDGNTAFYVYGFDSSADGVGAQPPVVAFAAEKDANKWAKKLGGEVYDFEELWDELEAPAAEPAE
jgi:hypothetical protein